MNKIPLNEVKICLENILLRSDPKMGKALYLELKKEDENNSYEWLQDIILFVDTLNSERE
jgi:hypothetical protein